MTCLVLMAQSDADVTSAEGSWDEGWDINCIFLAGQEVWKEKLTVVSHEKK